MADEKKTQASAKKPKPEAKAEAKPAAKPAPKAEAKPVAKPAAKADAKPAAKSGEAKAKGKATAAVTDGPTCRVDKCRQAVRAKGFCRKHYMAWRRGEVGDHHRYKICSKEACRKPRSKGGLCDEHAGTAAPAAAPAAEGGAPA